MFRRNKNLLGILAICIGLIFQGCSKDDDSLSNLESTHDFSGLAAFNAIEGPDNLQFFVDGKLINKTNEDFSIGGYLNHRTVFPGNRKLELKNLDNQVFFSADKKFESTKIYTYFFFGKNSQPVVTEDDMIKPDAGLMRVRIINLVTDSKLKLDFDYLSTKYTSNFDNRVFGSNEFSSKVNFKFRVSSPDKKYESIEIPLDGKDRSVYSIVVYSSQEDEGRVLKYRKLEM